jgi:hypothetical protein
MLDRWRQAVFQCAACEAQQEAVLRDSEPSLHNARAGRGGFKTRAGFGEELVRRLHQGVCVGRLGQPASSTS